jgi:cytochrome c551/c552
MVVHRMYLMIIAVVLAGCGPVSQKLPRSASDLPPPVGTTWSFDAVARGRIVFDNACFRCHGIESGTDEGPALRDVSRRYRAELEGVEAVTERVADWIVAPSADRSLVAAGVAGQRELMRRVALDRDLALDVGYFVWSLGEPAGMVGQR